MCILKILLLLIISTVSEMLVEPEISIEPVLTPLETTEEEECWPVLTPSAGVVYGPSGKETYYNLDMSYCVEIMHDNGFVGEYWVRDDGAKMFGDYIMVAADLSIRPKGTILDTSLGKGIVVDTGSFIYSDQTQIDIAVTW